MEQNTLNKNRWGIYLNFADWIDVSANDLRENTQKDIFDAGGVTRLQAKSVGQSEDELKRLRALSPPIAKLDGPQSAIIGQVVEFDARTSRDPASSELKFNWDLGDGTLESAPHIQHAFKRSGFHRLGLTVTNGTLSDLAWRDFYVVEDLPELATEGQANLWGSINESNLKIRFQDDSATKLTGKSSVHAVLDPYHGARASLLFPQNQSANWSLDGKTHLVFWLKTINPNLAWQDANPLIKLYSPESNSLSLTPKKDLLNQPSFNEAREGWKYFEIPLAGDNQWQREGTAVKTLHHLTIGVDSWDAQPLELWIDGLAFKTK